MAENVRPHTFDTAILDLKRGGRACHSLEFQRAKPREEGILTQRMVDAARAPGAAAGGEVEVTKLIV
ncbi:hypothetical protein [Rhizobium miluonense]|uniref:Uncharacterized protein n=1 Tax=Rhizobium miluonense TaxID=411945 RepID=A0ABU1SXJ3_9HYPH|nr:hypothetical protein [Rhizobium miluonense]MDR6903695.1 hypothetical protein [Rhizobium miluonense]